jgi:hypothetical protein
LSVTAAKRGTHNQVTTAAATKRDPILAYAPSVDSGAVLKDPPGPSLSTNFGYAVACPVGASVNPCDPVFRKKHKQVKD